MTKIYILSLSRKNPNSTASNSSNVSGIPEYTVCVCFWGLFVFRSVDCIFSKRRLLVFVVENMLIPALGMFKKNWAAWQDHITWTHFIFFGYCGESLYRRKMDPFCHTLKRPKLNGICEFFWTQHDVWNQFIASLEKNHREMSATAVQVVLALAVLVNVASRVCLWNPSLRDSRFNVSRHFLRNNRNSSRNFRDSAKYRRKLTE